MSWRNSLPVHDAANLFPLLPEAELEQLGNDIKMRGLTSPIAIQVERGSAILVDGRNRLDALELVGLRVSLVKTNTGSWRLVAKENLTGEWEEFNLNRQIGATVTVVTCDPVEYITSVNIHRRHLTTETKRDLIAKLLKEKPERSDRATAALVKVDHKTVAAVRRKEEDVGSIPHVEKRVDTKGRQQPATKESSRPYPFNLIGRRGGCGRKRNRPCIESRTRRGPLRPRSGLLCSPMPRSPSRSPSPTSSPRPRLLPMKTTSRTTSSSRSRAPMRSRAPRSRKPDSTASLTWHAASCLCLKVLKKISLTRSH